MDLGKNKTLHPQKHSISYGYEEVHPTFQSCHYKKTTRCSLQVKLCFIILLFT